MPVLVQRGPYKGHQIRKARISHRCENRRAHLAGNAPNCNQTINPGHYYVETEVDPYEAGGFGMSKLCMGCAGLEARAAVDHQSANQLDLQDAKHFGLANEWGVYDRDALRAAQEKERAQEDPLRSS